MRKISALYGPYSFELGVDLRESITMCDVGGVFTIPGNIEISFASRFQATLGRPRFAVVARLWR